MTYCRNATIYTLSNFKVKKKYEIYYSFYYRNIYTRQDKDQITLHL